MRQNIIHQKKEAKRRKKILEKHPSFPPPPSPIPHEHKKEDENENGRRCF
jgi:hypothetical protein